MTRLFFILLLALAPVQAFAEEDVSAPPASLKSPEIAPEEKPAAADQAPEPETAEPAQDSDKPAPQEEAAPLPPAEDKAEEEAAKESDEAKAEPPAAEGEETKEDTEELAAEPEATPEEPAAPPAPRKWNVLPDGSSIGFSGTQMGKGFEGVIKTFKADILFADANLEQSRVTVDIDLLSLDAKDDERNKTVKGDDWLDVAKFPAARFETKSITKAEDGSYLADATLTIHGVSQPLQLPFTLAFSKVEKGADKGKDLAVMTGKVVLDRSKFQLGQGEWEDPSIIANEITVDVKVSAIGEDKAAPATP